MAYSKKYFLVLFCLWAAVIVGCRSRENPAMNCAMAVHSDLTYIVSDSFTIHLPQGYKEGFYTAPLARYTYTDREYMYIMDDEHRTILKYDIRKDSMCELIGLPKIPGTLIDFHIDEPDLLLLATSAPSYLYRIRLSDPKHIEQLLVGKNKSELFNSYPFLGDHLRTIIESPDTFIVANISLKAYRDAEMYARMNIRTGELVANFFHYPETDKEFFPLLVLPSKEDVDTLTFMAQGYDHFVNIYNNRTGEHLGCHCLRSKYIAEERIRGLSPEPEPEFQEMNVFMISNAWYYGLVYDPYRNMFLRTVKHTQPLKEDNGKLKQRYDGPWSIIAANTDLSVKGEVLMPAGTYKPYVFIPVKDGIALSLNKGEGKATLNFHIIQIKP